MLKSFRDSVWRAFCGKETSGSLQFLHYYKSKELMESDAQSFVVEDAYDHSFVYKESDRAYVSWKNKAGMIQLCGAASYTLAFEILTQQGEGASLQIISPFCSLRAFYNSGKVFLELPVRKPLFLCSQHFGEVFCFSETGVFLVQLKDREALAKDSFLESCLDFLSEEFKGLIHGLCFFHFHSKVGALRYFTPWHGRKEDYVTGSMHSYLAPLINDLFSVSKHMWFQESSSPGVLSVEYDGSSVRIQGECVSL